MQQPIAVLDSGVGGLTVVKEMMRQLPGEAIVYFGDTARAPYGSRPPEEVARFTREIVDYLTQFHPKMIIIACNTSTAFALDDIRRLVQVPVVGVIKPGARAAVGRTVSGCVGVIGTEGTIRSGAYETALLELSPDVRVISEACPQFVPLVERGDFRSHEAYKTIRQSIGHLRMYPIDSLILGCTHYPFLSETISEVMGTGISLISSAEETTREATSILRQSGMLSDVRMPVHQFFCSGNPDLFQTIARQWLGEHMELRPIVWRVPQIC
ncbi:glutamate racemase [Paenibacillus sp. NPDC058071]|uniref:glutamate racemase n=1 Tax=Paenibacillus sp. NPDC058071 TaxID=3346326 RepID=UPI0036D7B1E9